MNRYRLYATASLTVLLSLLCSSTPAAAEAALGAPAPTFALPSAAGTTVSLSDFRGKIVVLEWFNAGCPFVKKQYRAHAMQQLQTDFTKRGVIWLTVNSTNPEHRDYLTPEKSLTFYRDNGLASTALLLDPSGTVGRLYGAKTTPHLFLIDANGVLAYRGAVDDDDDVAGDPARAHNYLRSAVEEILAGKSVTTKETRPYGCSVKY